MEDRFAPDAAAVVHVGADAELVGRVGLQVVDDGVTGGAGLIVPLPVPLPVADGVEANGQKDGVRRFLDLQSCRGDEILSPTSDAGAAD